ncbi:regulatory particle non-ATPase [Zalaria obscura]|uniref:Regulatory particle non-ATPase n=1 Tax=Zalaria obscura TaxID=2024903 RepID=A0ACC3SET7_9PEZI
MSAQPCTDNSERITTLRQELKAWEKTFAASHDGRKAGRDDIKANPEIAEESMEEEGLEEADKTGHHAASLA